MSASEGRHFILEGQFLVAILAFLGALAGESIRPLLAYVFHARGQKNDARRSIDREVGKEFIELSRHTMGLARVRNVEPRDMETLFHRVAGEGLVFSVGTTRRHFQEFMRYLEESGSCGERGWQFDRLVHSCVVSWERVVREVR